MFFLIRKQDFIHKRFFLDREKMWALQGDGRPEASGGVHILP